MRKIKALLYQWISQRYMHGCTNYNTLKVRRACRSKAQARQVFARNGVPHAHGMIFCLPWRVKRFVAEHGFPVVIKPNVGGYSRGSYFPIIDNAGLWRAILLAKIWWPNTVLEQYLSGANYRVLTTDKNIVSVIRRYPPFVTGNGKDCISALIDEENSIRARMKLYPTMFPISKSKPIIAHLKKQKLNLRAIPHDGQYVELFHRVALAPGGVVEIVEQSNIAAENCEFFMQIVKMFSANLLGIDVIFEKGIEISYKQQRCIFIEVNSRPYAAMHHFPRYGKVQDLAARFAELEQLDIVDKDIF